MPFGGRSLRLNMGMKGGGWCTKPVLGTYGVSVWKSIRSGKLDYSKFLRFDVGDGTRIKL